MAHLNAVSGRKTNYPIKIEGDGCLAYDEISIFMN